MLMVLELMENEPRTLPMVFVLDAIEVTHGDVPCCTAPMFPVLVLTLTLKAEVGVTEAVICDDGVVVTVH